MAHSKTVALPIPELEYDHNTEAVTRRIIEQALQDLAIEIDRLSRLQDVNSSKAIKRHQFLLMGMKHG